jgi:hypothetical protein
LQGIFVSLLYLGPYEVSVADSTGQSVGPICFQKAKEFQVTQGEGYFESVGVCGYYQGFVLSTAGIVGVTVGAIAVVGGGAAAFFVFIQRKRNLDNAGYILESEVEKVPVFYTESE